MLYDFLQAMWLMLQQDKPEDFVISTGVAHSVREFVEAAFKQVDIEIKWVSCFYSCPHQG